MKMKNQILFLMLVLLSSGLAPANPASSQLPQVVSFDRAWGKIRSDSPAIESSQLQVEALGESQKRAARHWLPRVYLDAKSYQTNDPGASFFGLLEQRSLQQSDFNPDLINHQDAHVYTRGALGLDLPLYEGGLKSAQADVYKYSFNAQSNATSQVELEQYSQAGMSYASIAVLEQQKAKLQTLQSEIIRMIKGYQLGSKSNPIGYSGLLGMKSLANRLAGLIDQYESMSRAYYLILFEMGLKDPSWIPENMDSVAFVDQYFPATQIIDTQTSYKAEASKESAFASLEMANMEKAQFLPRIGIFAESYVFKGDRATANGYNAGLYLQWNLFDSSSYGSLREAKLKAMSASKYSESIGQQERAERSAMLEKVKSLKANLALLNDSDNLLSEQTKMTATLFRNGSINALQIVEILSRRTDLIAQQSEARLDLIKVSSQSVTKQKFEIKQHLSSGAKK